MHKKVIEGSMVAQHIPSTMQITNIMIKHIIVLALSSLSQEFMFFHFQAWEGLINQVRFLQLLPLHVQPTLHWRTSETFMFGCSKILKENEEERKLRGKV